ncbi:P-loop NTPase fold protein [Dysgonomonas sp. GY617]|uniref:KAP family P-loop NTPase fold protein n=1 Tax=Dysgonomonas sp. GY617 TaxID=2780420 RepID=UPI001883C8A6|nr:P-loop NTPase fold protein [Dysgonomonas sp. GY617]MBF0577595.1 NTPase [Dysgonomonas sp. GY617]
MWKDCETNIDLLDFDYLVDVAKNIIMDNNLTPSTVGIYGDWGSGKSSLMDMVMSDLSKEDNVLCLKFNGWLFEGYEDAKVALIGSILDEIGKKKRLTAKAKGILKNLYDNTDFIKLTSKLAKYGIDFLLTGGLLTISDITIDNIKNALASKGTQVEEQEIEGIFKAFKSKEVRKSIKSFHEDFALLLEKTNIKRLIVFIDELDRCKHDTILETLEAIRLFLFAKGTSFVIGADERQIRYAVQMKYPDVEGNQMDIGKEYLEKLIQYPIRIPQLGQKEVESYIMYLLFEKDFNNDLVVIRSIINKEKEENFLDFELTYELIKTESEDLAEKLKDTISLSKQISSVLAKGLNGNPRHCKRFLNAMELRIMMANYRKIPLDRRVLAKLMLIEYFKDPFYKRLAQLQANENGKPKELVQIEGGKWEEENILNTWKDDAWIVDWLTNIEPLLANVDLRPYFYFSRESQKNMSFAKSQNLSQNAIKIIQNLLSGTDTLRNEAMKSATNVSDFEAASILNEIAVKMESSTEIEKSLFQSFIEWGGSRSELYIDTIAILERLSMDRIKFAFIPLIPPFANKLTDKTKIREILSKWESQKTLKSAIEEELKNIK